MITRKELGYVNTWANKVPYPGMDYCEEVVDKLKVSFNLYQEEYSNKKYNISFSNNEEIEFQILDKNICHMLGIDFKNLSGDYFKNFRKEILHFDPEKGITSYELLKLLIDNINGVLHYDEQHAARTINYYKVGIKCDIFTKLANLSEFKYGCINFNKDEFLSNNPEVNFSSRSTKFLYTPSDEIVSPYFMMGLRKLEEKVSYIPVETDEEIDLDKENNNYIVETLIAPENIKSLFENQEVVIPTQILTDDNGTLTKNTASTSEKIKLLKEYQSIINQYRLNSRVNIYGDYLSLLMSQERENTKIM